eukprot:Pgem_evm1s19882
MQNVGGGSVATPTFTQLCSTADFQIFREQFQKCKTDLSQNGIVVNDLTNVEWQACPYYHYLSDCVKSIEENDFKKISLKYVTDSRSLHFMVKN